MRALAVGARRWLGLGRRWEVDGVEYRAVDSQDLREAVADGREKVFRVVFPSGRRMRIAASRRRMLSDLSPIPQLDALDLMARVVRPGGRALAVNTGTGLLGARLGAALGPSGALVALDRDEVAVRFARERFAGGNVSYEVLTPGRIGETPGSFDFAVVFEEEGEESDAELLGDLWGLVMPGGWLGVCLRAPGARWCGPEHVPTTETEDAEPTPEVRRVTEEMRRLGASALRAVRCARGTPLVLAAKPGEVQ